MCVCVVLNFFFFIKNSSVIGEPNFVFLCVISLLCRSSSTNENAEFASENKSNVLIYS